MVAYSAAVYWLFRSGKPVEFDLTAHASGGLGRLVAVARASKANPPATPSGLIAVDGALQVVAVSRIAPEQPVVLNFLGYAKLERGEDVDAAEAMIRKASELAPDDASITDSLGWAQFKRGKIAEAIGTLQRAAESLEKA